MDYIFDGIEFQNLYQMTDTSNEMVTEEWDNDSKELHVTIRFVPG